MKNILFLTFALTFMSCAHTHNHRGECGTKSCPKSAKTCCLKSKKQCTLKHKKKNCDEKKTCKTHKKCDGKKQCEAKS